MMLNRRFLRIKTMQGLYAFLKHEEADRSLHERELFKGIELVYDLYASVLQIFSGLRTAELMLMEENKNKKLPGPDDLNPNLAFVNNSLLISISECMPLHDIVEKKKLRLITDSNLLRKLLYEIKKAPEYIAYMKLDQTTTKDHSQLLIQILTNVLEENEVLNSVFEEKSIYWSDDKHIVLQAILKQFDSFTGEFKLVPLMKDEADDKEFVKILFNKTIVYKEENLELIKNHVKNWELDRIAEMDILLMQMCLTEILHLPNIPIKASLNEYIDISKEYSTPNSRLFINGILDKAIAQLRQENRIVKQGRGLKES